MTRQGVLFFTRRILSEVAQVLSTNFFKGSLISRRVDEHNLHGKYSDTLRCGHPPRVFLGKYLRDLK